MRLNSRDIEREIDESIADGQTTTGLRSRTKVRVRAPYSSRDRSHASERNSSGRRPWEEKTKEGAI